MHQRVDIRGAFLNAQFTSDDEPIYLGINKDIVLYWILQDPSAASYVTEQGQLLLLLDRFLYDLKRSPLKFQLHLTRTLVDAGYKMTNAYFTKTRDQSSVMYQLTRMTYSTVLIALLWPTSSKIY